MRFEWFRLGTQTRWLRSTMHAYADSGFFLFDNRRDLTPTRRVLRRGLPGGYRAGENWPGSWSFLIVSWPIVFVHKLPRLTLTELHTYEI